MSEKHSSGLMSLLVVVLVVVFLAVTFFMILPAINNPSVKARQIACMANMRMLSMMVHMYSKDNGDEFPTSDKWCDLIEPYNNDERVFVCPAAKRAGSGARSHYAINPNADPNSPGDVVLFFETSGGWNQYGGVGLIYPDNHDRPGSYVVFRDLHVEFVDQKDFGSLNWGKGKAVNSEEVNNE